MRFDLRHLIFAGMILGLLVGAGLGQLDTASASFKNILWILDLIGKTLFIGALKALIAPLILASIVAGVTSLPNLKELGQIGWKTLAFYIGTTTLAVAIGLVLVLAIRPGETASSKKLRDARAADIASARIAYEIQSGRTVSETEPDYLRWLHNRESTKHAMGDADAGRWSKLARAQDRTSADIFKEDLIQPILTNPFLSLAETNSLGIIFFALIFGIGCIVVGPAAQPVIHFFRGLNEVIMKITGWLMTISPLAVGCLVASLVAQHGLSVFQSLGWYCGTVILGILIHVCCLLLICRWMGRMSPLAFLKGIREAWMVAFSTRSSAATLPVTLRCVNDELKVNPKVSNFSVPLGMTINMDGTALYEGVAVIFLIQIYGGLDDARIILAGMTTFLIFITAVFASVGAAAVPDAGLVTMVLVAGAVGLPIYYIPLIFAVDAFLDMFRTSTNVMGDCVGAVVVAELEKDRLSAS